MSAQHRKTMYRQFIRNLLRSNKLHDAQKRKSLVLLFKPQVRALLHSTPDHDLEELSSKLQRSSTLAAHTNRNLTRNLAALSYNHYPHLIPRTKNARRTPWALPSIRWDPQQPDAARKAFESDKRRQQREAHQRMDELAMSGLAELIDLAERSSGVVLGRPSGDYDTLQAHNKAKHSSG
ncbi:hypothetical protein ACM66B_000854 [Microbotryomycetes sp. NB124-2]